MSLCISLCLLVPLVASMCLWVPWCLWVLWCLWCWELLAFFAQVNITGKHQGMTRTFMSARMLHPEQAGNVICYESFQVDSDYLKPHGNFVPSSGELFQAVCNWSRVPFWCRAPLFVAVINTNYAITFDRSRYWMLTDWHFWQVEFSLAVSRIFTSAYLAVMLINTIVRNPCWYFL